MSCEPVCTAAYHLHLLRVLGLPVLARDGFRGCDGVAVMAYIPNFDWTVGDMDRANFMAQRRELTIEQVEAHFRNTSYACDRSRLERICHHFGIRMRAEATRLEAVR